MRPAINRDTFAADLINALLLRPVYRNPEPVVECEECGRTGSDGFVWFQGEIMLCADEKACKRRAAEKGCK